MTWMTSTQGKIKAGSINCPRHAQWEVLGWKGDTLYLPPSFFSVHVPSFQEEWLPARRPALPASELGGSVQAASPPFLPVGLHLLLHGWVLNLCKWTATIPLHVCPASVNPGQGRPVAFSVVHRAKDGLMLCISDTFEYSWDFDMFLASNTWNICQVITQAWYQQYWKPCNPWWMYHCTKYKPKRRWGMQVAGDIVSIPVQQLPDSRKTFEDLYYPISSFFHLELFRFNWKLCSYGSKKKYCYCQQEVVTSIQLFA